MKVLFTFNGLPHYSNLVLNKLNRINNLDIYVVVPTEGSSTIGKGVFQSTEGIEFNILRLKEFRTFYKKFFFSGFLSLLKELSPDVVVFVWPYNLGLLFFPWILLYIKIRKIKIIYKDIPFLLPKFWDGLLGKNLNLLNEDLTKVEITLGVKFYHSFFTLMRWIYYRFFDAHVNYVEDAYSLLGTYAIPKEKIFITYNSPDTDELLTYKEKAISISSLLPYSNKRIIHIGRLVKWKKVDLLINSVKILKNKFHDIELIIIGSGPEESTLKKLTTNFQLEDNIKFIGAIYDPVILGRYLLDSTIYVLAGMGGLSINEAMAYEKPVICSFCDGTEKKLVRDNYNGKIFNNDNLSSLTKCIDEILSNPDDIIKMGRNSFEIISKEVNIYTVIKGYLSAFNYVTSNKFDLRL